MSDLATPAGYFDVLDGVVDHVLHVSYNQLTVVRLAALDSPEETVTALGKALFGVQPGESLRLNGTWSWHHRYGRQFTVEECKRTRPAGERAIRLYLASGLIRGIGPVLATAIVEAFHEDTLNVIDAEPQRLLGVRNIGQVRLARITEAWQEQKAVREIMLFLQGLGITPGLAVKIYNTYADSDDDAMEVVRNTPFRLCRDVHGVGFANADKIALAVGIPKHSDERLQAALLHVLDQAGGQGHCHLPSRVLIARTRKLLDDADPATEEILDNAVLRCALGQLRRMGEAVVEKLPFPVHPGAEEHADIEICLLPRWHRDETQLARHVKRLLASRPSLADCAPWAERLAVLTNSQTAGLTQEQLQGVLGALTGPFSVLTGGPGCGKTHTLRTLVEVAEEADAVVALAAPTGKAAKRLEETCGHPATTVHRLIRPPDGDSLFDHASPLDKADLIIIDESSMLDLSLACRLFAAVREGSHLLLVGDIDQLPSVGPGQVLANLLEVDSVPRTRLTRVFRQSTDSSAIIDNAHRILRGQPPLEDSRSFWNRPLEEAEDTARRVVELVSDILPKHLGVRPEDIQVLCPGKKHIAGMTDLNLRLQRALNPAADAKPEHYHAGVAFRLGDRVQQIRNNPHRGPSGVFNGSSGVVTSVQTADHYLDVTFPDGEIRYAFTDLDELVHAYALTVHRSQGSEYPYVIVPMTNSAGMMLLQRNLLYTAVTRAREGVLLIGHRAAVGMALANYHSIRRNTALVQRITEVCDVLPTQRREQGPVGQLAWE